MKTLLKALFPLGLLLAASSASQAADAPTGPHCGAVVSISQYYGSDTAFVYHYPPGEDVDKILSQLTTVFNYSDQDAKHLVGTSNIYVALDSSDGSAAVFFYGDNDCLFGYDDNWDIVSLTNDLRKASVRIEVGPGFFQLPGTPGALDGFTTGGALPSAPSAPKTNL